MTELNKQNSKLRGDIHHALMADFVPQHPFKPKYEAAPDRYDSLTDASSFSDYAWAFLRRNRFYQNSIDKVDKRYLNIDIWGYRPSDDSPAIDGLSFKKNYWEKCLTKEAPLKWEGIHNFFESYSSFRKPIFAPVVTGKFSNIQLPFVFDIDPLLGPNTSAIDVQLQIARAILFNQAKKAGLSAGRPQTTPTKEKMISIKKDLRALLRIADLLSPEYKETPPVDIEGDTRKPLWEFGEEKPKLKALVPKLLESDIGRKSSQNKSASELVERAYEMIYDWKLLQLLQYDNWDDYFSAQLGEAAI